MCNLPLIRHKLKKYFTTFIILGLYAIPVAASEFRGEDDVTIDREEVIGDDLYIFANYGEVRGSINGDLTAFCYEFSSNGDVDGNANVFAYDIDFIGKINRSARLFGYKVRSNGPVKGNMLAYAKEIKLGQKSFIGKDLSFGAGDIRMDGIIAGNVDGAGEKVVISGRIDGNVNIETKQLIITSPAVINGELNYTSINEAIIDEDVVIKGEVVWQEKEKKIEKENQETSFGFKILYFIAALITGLVLILLFKNHFNDAIQQLEINFWNTLAIGCLSFLGLTFGAIVPAVLIVGIPISVMMICLGLILFYIGKIYIAIALARYLYGLINRGTKLPIGLELLFGLIILSVLFELPAIGWVIYIGAFLLGTGAAINGFRAQCKRIAEAKTSPS